MDGLTCANHVSDFSHSGDRLPDAIVLGVAQRRDMIPLRSGYREPTPAPRLSGVPPTKNRAIRDTAALALGSWPACS